MGRSKKAAHAVAEETSNPPTTLTPTQKIAQIIKSEGNGIWTCTVPEKKEKILVELPSRFHNTIWLRWGGFVLIDTNAADLRNTTLDGQIINVVRDERLWRKQAYWPEEFKVNRASPDLPDSDEEESIVVKMPDSDSE